MAVSTNKFYFNLNITINRHFFGYRVKQER